MFAKLSYNQMKLLKLMASAALIGAQVLGMAVKESLLVDGLVIVTAVAYIISIFLFVKLNRSEDKVMVDELSRQNETKAAEFSNLVVTAAAFVGVIFTQLAHTDVSLSYPVLFCVLIGISAVGDGYYLYVERKGMKAIHADDED